MTQCRKETEVYISKLKQVLRNTSEDLSEPNKKNTTVDNYDDNYTSDLLKYYGLTITKYANQKHSNELISFKLLKDNIIQIQDLLETIIDYLDTLSEEEITETLLYSFLNKLNQKQIGEDKEENEENEEEEEETHDEKIKGFNQKQHFDILKLKEISYFISTILNKKISIKYKKAFIYEGYGLCFEEKYFIHRMEIFDIEENDKLPKTKKLTMLELETTDNVSKKSQIQKFRLDLEAKKYDRIKDFELLSLAETIYMQKYDKLIKKSIYEKVKSRFFIGKNTYNPLQDPNLFERLRNEAISFAIEGFLIGIRRYSTESKVKLITYITWWVEQRIVYYIENFSSINKGKKTIHKEEDFEIGVDDEGNMKFQKYANIQFENYQFIKSDDIAKYEELEKLQFSSDSFARHDGKIYDILQFFCKQHDEIFLPFEYLLIKYDILLEEYIYFMDIAKDDDIKDCFYKEINNVNLLLKNKYKDTYKDLMEFDGIKSYFRLPETLMLYFNIEKKEYLTVKRILKQKLINILKNVFLEKKKRVVKKKDVK